MRAFLSPTETFIGNQITTLQAYRPVVFCHHRLPNASYPFPNVHCVQELLPPLPRLLDSVSYRLARHLPRVSAEVIAERIEAESVRLLHFHYLVDARFFLALKRLTGLPAVVSAYGYDVSSFPRQLAGYGRRYLQAVCKEMDCFLAMSFDMKHDMVKLGCPEHKIKVHYHGIDTDRFHFPGRTYPPKDVVNILVCASLVAKKGQLHVLQALHEWQQRTGVTSFELTFVGDGPLRPQLESTVQHYGWDGRVRFLGHIPHHLPRLVQEYHRADVFVLPSTTANGDKEGIPGTLVEAMASGLPVVSTHHAGIPELISHETNGLLVAERDVTALSQALGRLIEDRGLRERLGQAATRTVQDRGHLPSRTVALEAIYDELLDHASNPRTLYS